MANSIDAKIRPQEFNGAGMITGATRQVTRVGNVLEFAPAETNPSTAAVLHGAGTTSSRVTPPTATTANLNFLGYFLETSATTGDTRGMYIRLYFSGAGSGEALRAYGTVNAANVATGGTVNGAHISLSVASGGTVSGAAHALRATLDVAASVTPGGTISVLQVDSNIGADAVPGNTAFISFDNVGTAPTTNGLAYLFQVTNPNTDSFFVDAGTGTGSAGITSGGVAAKVLKCRVGSTDYWLPLFSSNGS